MSRKFQIVALVLLGAIAGLVVGGWCVYRAVRQVQPFYQQALKLEPEVLEKGSHELESRASALYSDTRQSGDWHALFTTEQINGWLAVQLVQSHAHLLPEGVDAPRVAISPNNLTLGFRTRQGGIETVISVDAMAHITDSGDIAVQLIDVRAGSLPLPVMQVADEIAQACKTLSLPIHWTQLEGNPVALIEVETGITDGDRRIFIDTIELLEGELYVAGHTEEKGSSGTFVGSRKRKTW